MSDIPLRAIVKQLEEQVSLLSSTVTAIQALGGVINVDGSPEGVTSGYRFALDVTNQLLYVNPNPNSTTGWIALA